MKNLSEKWRDFCATNGIDLSPLFKELKDTIFTLGVEDKEYGGFSYPTANDKRGYKKGRFKKGDSISVKSGYYSVIFCFIFKKDTNFRKLSELKIEDVEVDHIGGDPWNFRYFGKDAGFSNDDNNQSIDAGLNHEALCQFVWKNEKDLSNDSSYHGLGIDLRLLCADRRKNHGLDDPFVSKVPPKRRSRDGAAYRI